MSDNDLISLSDVSKEFDGTIGTRALNTVTLDIARDEFVAIMGPSGSGKTTLLSLVGGLDYPTSGEIIVDEIPLHKLGTSQLAEYRRNYVGFIFQQFHLIKHLNVLENVLLPLAIADGSSKTKDELARRAVSKVGLSGKEEKLPGKLSGGEQQRVAIARAIVNEPQIILADEPTGNLDTATGQQIMDLLSELNQEGSTVILVTHNEKNAMMAKRAVKLVDGRLINT